MATLDAAKPPAESPQRRERCPQNMFDPILRDFAAAQPSVTLRYRTRLVSFTQDADGVTAEVEDRDRRPRAHPRAVSRRLRRRPQPGARDARHRHGRHRGAHLHHQRDLPLPRPGRAARQGPRLSVHHPRPRGHLVDHRRHQRHRPVALLDHRRQRAARLFDRRDPRADPPRGRPRLRLRDPHRHAVGAARAGGRALRRRAASTWRATPCTCSRPPARSA